MICDTGGNLPSFIFQHATIKRRVILDFNTVEYRTAQYSGRTRSTCLFYF